MNRLKEYLDEPPEPERKDDYYVIEACGDTFAVSRETADDVVCQLDERPPRRWLTFRDNAATWHRILAAYVWRISECTAAQRQATREFDRARRKEDKADRRPWDDDD